MKGFFRQPSAQNSLHAYTELFLKSIAFPLWCPMWILCAVPLFRFVGVSVGAAFAGTVVEEAASFGIFA